MTTIRRALVLCWLAALGVGCPDDVPDNGPDAARDAAPPGPDAAADAGLPGPDAARDAAPPGPDAAADATVCPDSGAPVDAAVPDPLDLVEQGVYPGCRRDAFFVKVPLWHPPLPEDFADNARADLRDTVDAVLAAGGPWFCPEGDADCVAGLEDGVTVEVAPLLERRPQAPPPRDTAHRRFFRVRFHAGERRLSVRPEALTEALAAIRATARRRGDSPEVYVGRECDAIVLRAEGTAADPANPMRTWHLERLGVDVGGQRPAAESVVVALVDTGLDPAFAAAIGVEEADPVLPPALAAEPPHRHGAAMALLVRQIAPAARVRSYRAFDADGIGLSGDVARAVDRALADAEAGAPLVINLSVGWPPELGRARGPDPDTGEDPLGESLRFVLDLARRRDASGEGPTLVVSAAGNRPDAADPLQANLERGREPAEPCGAGLAPPGTPGLFFPAEWSRRRSCRQPDDPAASALVLAAGGIDAQNRPTALSIPGAEPPLVAPAEHVYVWSDAAAPTPTDPACAQCPPGPPESLTLPAAFTGTSVAAALTSGAAAYAWGRRLAEGRALPDGATLARLLYLAGEPLGAECDRRSPEGLVVRRLSVSGLDALLDCEALPDLLRCLAEGADGSIGGPDAALAQRCPAADLRSQCGLADACRGIRPEPVVWPATYPPDTVDDGPTCRVARLPPGTDPQDAAACNGPCPFTRRPDRHSVGAAGPQPEDPICPDCAVLAATGGDPLVDALTLYLEINPVFKPGTTFTDPYLVVYSSDGDKAYVDLGSADDWKPGATVVLKGLAVKAPLPSSAADWKLAKAVLVAGVRPPGSSLSTQDVSPLRVIVK